MARPRVPRMIELKLGGRRLTRSATEVRFAVSAAAGRPEAPPLVAWLAAAVALVRGGVCLPRMRRRTGCGSPWWPLARWQINVAWRAAAAESAAMSDAAGAARASKAVQLSALYTSDGSQCTESAAVVQTNSTERLMSPSAPSLAADEVAVAALGAELRWARWRRWWCNACGTVPHVPLDRRLP